VRVFAAMLREGGVLVIGDAATRWIPRLLLRAARVLTLGALEIPHPAGWIRRELERAGLRPVRELEIWRGPLGLLCIESLKP